MTLGHRIAGFALALLIVAGLAVPPMRTSAGTQELIISLDGLIKTFPGSAGIWIADPNAPEPLFALHEDESIVTASLYKLALLLEVERRVEAGSLSYDSTITIEEDDVTDEGSYELPGTVMSIDQALETMITYSDNGSALAFLRMLGPNGINATLAQQKISGFHIAVDDVEDNVATARAIGTFFTLLARKQLVSAKASDRMLRRLERQRINDRLPAALPPGTVIAHKTGNLVGLVHDAGIVSTKFGPRVVVVMTQGADDDAANSFIADVSSALYGAVFDPPTNARYATPRTTSGDIGVTLPVSITVTNAGTRPWTATGLDAYGLVWEIFDANRQAVGKSAAPKAIGSLALGRSVGVPLTVMVPATPGDYTVRIGLVDRTGNPLVDLGAATESFPLRAHVPFLAKTSIRVPRVLHRGESSLVTVSYTPLFAAGGDPHPIALTYRFIDPKTSGLVHQGTVPLGTLVPGPGGTFSVPLTAPNITGSYRMEYEISENGRVAGATASTSVSITRARTYPGNEVRPTRR